MTIWILSSCCSVETMFHWIYATALVKMRAKTIIAMRISNEQIIIIAGNESSFKLNTESTRLFTFREFPVHLHFLVYRITAFAIESDRNAESNWWKVDRHDRSNKKKYPICRELLLFEWGFFVRFLLKRLFWVWYFYSSFFFSSLSRSDCVAQVCCG